MSSPKASWGHSYPGLKKFTPNPAGGRSGPAAGDQLPVVVEQRTGVVTLVGDVPPARVDHRQPRRARGEAAVGGAVPLHRMARAVAAGAVDRRVGARPV